jgi:nucleotide-binding universal stress UspA family protein
MERMETFQPKLILCPTDFSEPSALALHYGKHLADCFDARLVVLYADPFSPPPYFTSRQVEDLAKTIHDLKGAAHDYLDRFVRQHLGDTNHVDTVIIENQAVPAILLESEKNEVDMIVMGTHGRSGINRLMLGSVTEKILHETDRPVLTVPEQKGKEERSRISVGKVLCPVNYSDAALRALGHAVAMSQCFKAGLLVLHVIEPRSSDIKDEDEHERLCTWVPESLRSQCSLRETVRRGDAAHQIIEVASSEGCNMIVLGAQHKRFHDTTVLGTTTIRVTRHAPCPVLTVVRK